jgi:hypothetical protein
MLGRPHAVESFGGENDKIAKADAAARVVPAA